MEMEPLPTQVAEKKGGGDEAATLLVHLISTSSVHHSRQPQVEEQQCHLNPWDLSFLSIPYHQRGLLFPKPSTSHQHHNKQQQQEEGEGEEEKQETPIISLLRSSLASALNHFYPLAGRLATTCHDEYDTITVSIDCNNQGAQFTHATALAVTASAVLTPVIKPNVVASFFSLAGVVGHDGHSSPLLVVQITELSDAIFVGVTANHCAVDGRSLWHFINTWSAISRHGHNISPISFPPILDRWFPPPPFPSPIHLPFSGDSSTFIKRPIITPTSPDLAETTFHFSKTTISNLTTGAEAREISALEVVLAHFWVSTTRARRLDPDVTTVYIIVINFREKLNPPLPLQYFGNAVQTPVARERAGELVCRGLGWAAMLIHKSIAAETDEVGRRWVESWVKDPRLRCVNGGGGGFGAGSLFTASSPEYDVYGNDFGWGRPVAVRSGGEEGRFDGRTAVFGGREEGSMELEACLPVTVLESLMEDDEFMGQVVRA